MVRDCWLAEMYWLIASCIIFGAICGTVFRVLTFAVIAGAVATLQLANGLVRGDNTSVFSTLVALLTLQIGYVLGVILRAAIRWFLSRRTAGRLSRRAPAPTIGHKQR